MCVGGVGGLASFLNTFTEGIKSHLLLSCNTIRGGHSCKDASFCLFLSLMPTEGKHLNMLLFLGKGPPSGFCPSLQLLGRVVISR